MTLILKLNSDVWDLFEALDRIDEKIINNIPKTHVQFQYFKSYNRLYQRICELMRRFPL